MTVTHYNQFGTQSSRILVQYDTENVDPMNEARYLAARWNRDETRENMRVNFILCDGKITTV